MCPIRYTSIHSGANLNKINRNRKIENVEKSSTQLMIHNLFEMFRAHEKNVLK